jgi:hypothetical protein
MLSGLEKLMSMMMQLLRGIFSSYGVIMVFQKHPFKPIG